MGETLWVQIGGWKQVGENWWVETGGWKLVGWKLVGEHERKNLVGDLHRYFCFADRVISSLV